MEKLNEEIAPTNDEIELELLDLISEKFNESLYDLFKGFKDKENLSNEEIDILKQTTETNADASKLEVLIACVSNLLVHKLESCFEPDSELLKPFDCNKSVKESFIDQYVKGWK